MPVEIRHAFLAVGGSMNQVLCCRQVTLFSLHNSVTNQLEVAKMMRSTCRDAVSRERHRSILLDLAIPNSLPMSTGWRIETTTEGAPIAVAPYYLGEAASVLRGLHDAGFVHGHVSPQNFLVTDVGDVLISDVQLDIAMRKEHFRTRHTVPRPTLWQYRPMEELMPLPTSNVDVPCSVEGDVYAFAVVVYESLVEKLPCQPRDFVRRIATDAHFSPMQRPISIKDDLVWTLLQECWRDDPARRPTMVRVENVFREVAS
ncbi:hypothetical protein JAAARDRAFT_254433 [Jaapia argillacea MUCL 33604]|uniref:Protein kinase domain-containing protein n=1 Tax=Jaapia argillacea MUCL 33604 TaxID=933084 RepID=A0A067PT60_9AGAM|nr:hypothetical protein JAAARDRAFT_254433 [Jaapia argillacea MUCL 33604]